MSDLLTSGREPAAHLSARSPVALALALVLGLGGGAVVLDRPREEEALVRVLAAGVRTADHADGAVAGVVSYARPQLDSAQAPLDVRRSLAALVTTTAGQQVPALARRRQRMAELSVPPWRPDLRRSRALAVRYLRAREEGLAAVATSYDSYGAPHPDVTAAGRQLRVALTDLVGAGRADAALRGAVSP